MASLGLAGITALAAATLCLSSGCSTVGYLAHSVGGHLDLLRSARPVPQWMADEAASAPLKERLALTQRIRDFAVSELNEPDAITRVQQEASLMALNAIGADLAGFLKAVK